MEPVVSPWLFYFAHVATGLDIATLIIAGVSSLVGMLVFLASQDVDDKRGMRIGKRFMIIGLICVLINILVPSEDTVYKMIAASLITPDNISTVENGTVEFIERLAEAIAKNIR